MTYADLTKAGVPLFAYGNFLTIALNFAILALWAATTRGWATSRIDPRSQAARRTRARASKPARSWASSNSEAWRRGRTIWRKPKVQKNGSGSAVGSMVWYAR